MISELLHAAAPEIVRSWASCPPNWLEVIAPIRTIEGWRLGRGELEALSLARELGADLVLLDDRKAIAVAERMNLPIAGTVSVLELAARRKLINLREALTKLRTTTFRCPTNIIDEVLQRNPQAD